MQGTLQIFDSLESLSSNACEHLNEITAITPCAFREYSKSSTGTIGTEKLQENSLAKWEQDLLDRATKEGHDLRAPNSASWIPQAPDISSEKFIRNDDLVDFRESLELFAKSYPLEIEPAIKKAKFTQPPLWVFFSFLFSSKNQSDLFIIIDITLDRLFFIFVLFP